MSNLQYHAYAGIGQWAKDNLGYNQSVRVGDVIHISGQGGWDPKVIDNISFDEDIAKQIDQAFENVDLALRDAGGKGWSQVFKVTSYHLPLDHSATEAMIRNFAKWMPDHKPLWTEIGVASLGAEGMRVEIEVQAYDKQE
ncbi:uncharacterized protein I303_108538 [Kwoniella dejecticola CBS 10117]|uniref:Endoribonuclease L-PSP n=1 Tax=Kwoniella dejecticola CBS 10117 TaxID=1296121 RepID=A0A1A5ZX50_9TREE|nr:endoribonuclease L-PSP [Kwoniella dejecticola CBS 10117]OBR82379.1 endoribonuclease L-PSP [Kwoniella dejecticola CBS 10117]